MQIIKIIKIIKFVLFTNFQNKQLFVYLNKRKFLLITNFLQISMNFLYKFFQQKTLSINFYYLLNFIFFLNLKKKQPKMNIYNCKRKNQYIYTIGLLLKLIDQSSKSTRRSNKMLKYLLDTVKDNFYDLHSSTSMVSIQGITKRFLNIINFLTTFLRRFKIIYLLLQPLKT